MNSRVAPRALPARPAAIRPRCQSALVEPRVFVITGPSGVGKGTLIRSLLDRHPELELAISATTRTPRLGEQDGVDYHFLDPDEFDRLVADGEFVEHAEYAGNRYGTLRRELDRRAAAGAPVVLEIDLQGARQVRRALPGAVQVFIAPPSVGELRARLVGRGTDDPQKVAERLELARTELAAAGEFTHVIVNDRLEAAVADLLEVLAAPPE
jgi:guanylate kinase